MHECSPREYARQGCIYASCRPFGSVSTFKGWHDAIIGGLLVSAAFMHYDGKGHRAFTHYAAFKGGEVAAPPVTVGVKA